MPEATKTTELISINDLKPANFLNIDLFRKNQEKLAKENPVIEIIDATTYKKSDASRKILKKGRTTLQNSKKTDLEALKNALINPLSKTYDDFAENDNRNCLVLIFWIRISLGVGCCSCGGACISWFISSNICLE